MGKSKKQLFAVGLFLGLGSVLIYLSQMPHFISSGWYSLRSPAILPLLNKYGNLFLIQLEHCNFYRSFTLSDKHISPLLSPREREGRNAFSPESALHTSTHFQL